MKHSWTSVTRVRIAPYRQEFNSARLNVIPKSESSVCAFLNCTLSIHFGHAGCTLAPGEEIWYSAL